MIKSAGDWIDRYIADRTLPMELKDKCADWQQELIDSLRSTGSRSERLLHVCKRKNRRNTINTQILANKILKNST